MKQSKKLWTLILGGLLTTGAFGQVKEVSSADQEVRELKVALNNDGSHYVKATFLNQVWVRHTWNNPGTTIDGYERNTVFDIGLRRTRFQLYGQLSDRLFFYTQVGQNNLTFSGQRKQGLFIHDALGELRIAGDQLSIGTGLTGWSGLSRYASPSVGSILSLDAPLYQQATNDINDQFLRKYSIYAKGKLGILDYRLAITKPMTIAASAVPDPGLSENAEFSRLPPELQYQVYVMFQFLDRESNLTPYTTGTYLGMKNVFNVGLGFIFQKDAMWKYRENTQIAEFSDLMLFAIDFFYDHPLNRNKGNAITAYLSVSSNDYGKNYVRNLGVMNPANGVRSTGSFNGPGNAFPMTGTGDAFYGQLGYLMNSNLLGDWGTLQPYVTSQVARMDRLDELMVMYELGCNWLVDRKHTKISVNYQSRPVYDNNGTAELQVVDRLGMMVLQMQVNI